MIKRDEVMEIIEDDDIYEERRYLSEKHIPDEIINREEETSKITGEIGRQLKNGMGENLLLFGPSGTGKTHLLKRVKEDIEDIIEKEDLEGNIIYLNCNNSTLFKIYVDLNKKLEINEYKGKGKSLGDVIDDLNNRVSELDNRFVFIFDEVDKIQETKNTSGRGLNDLIYHTTRMHERENNADLMIVLISNDHSIEDKIKNYNRSVFNPDVILIDEYNSNEIYEILKDRCDRAFDKERIEDSALRLLAAKICQEGYDIRNGLKVLRNIDKFSNSDKIKDDEISEALTYSEEDNTRKMIESLPHQNFLALSIIAGSQSKINTQSFYRIYKKFINESGHRKLSLQTLRKRILPNLEERGLIITKTQGKGRGEGVEKLYFLKNQSLFRYIDETYKKKYGNSLKKIFKRRR